MGMEPEDQHGLVRRQRQGGQSGQGHLSALATRQPKRGRQERSRSAVRQRPILDAAPLPSAMGWSSGNRRRPAETADRRRHRTADRDEIPLGGWLPARRYLGSLHRARQEDRANHLPPGRSKSTAPRQREI